MSKVVAILLWTASVSAATADHPIMIGMSAPLSGPGGESNLQLKHGLELGFARLNRSGGIGGRKVWLQALDDKALPELATSNTRQLLADGAVALTGYASVASVDAAYPAMADAGVALIGISNGAMDLRLPPRKYLFNVRASVNEEAAAIIHQLDALGASRVAILQQDDAAGIAITNGMTTELTRVTLRPVAIERVKPGSGAAAWNAALAKLCVADPEAVMLAVTPETALPVLRQAERQACRLHFYVSSDTGAALSAAASHVNGIAGVVSAQVLPSPDGPSTLALAYRQDAGAASDTSLSYAGLEGYLYARLIGDLLKRCGHEPVSTCLVTTLESQAREVQGFRLEFTAEERRGSRFVELTILDDRGHFRR